jgi:hypothetical protein
MVPAFIAAGIFGPGVLNAIPVGATALFGAGYGRRRRLYRCATCRSFVTPRSKKCDGCGGTIAGDIKHPDDRLDAEEALEREERS